MRRFSRNHHELRLRSTTKQKALESRATKGRYHHASENAGLTTVSSTATYMSNISASNYEIGSSRRKDNSVKVLGSASRKVTEGGWDGGLGSSASTRCAQATIRNTPHVVFDLDFEPNTATIRPETKLGHRIDTGMVRMSGGDQPHMRREKHLL